MKFYSPDTSTFDHFYPSYSYAWDIDKRGMPDYDSEYYGYIAASYGIYSPDTRYLNTVYLILLDGDVSYYNDNHTITDSYGSSLRTLAVLVCIK